jgi:hypothetical protein
VPAQRGERRPNHSGPRRTLLDARDEGVQQSLLIDGAERAPQDLLGHLQGELRRLPAQADLGLADLLLDHEGGLGLDSGSALFRGGDETGLLRVRLRLDPEPHLGNLVLQRGEARLLLASLASASARRSAADARSAFNC